MGVYSRIGVKAVLSFLLGALLPCAAPAAENNVPPKVPVIWLAPEYGPEPSGTYGFRTLERQVPGDPVPPGGVLFMDVRLMRADDDTSEVVMTWLSDQRRLALLVPVGVRGGYFVGKVRAVDILGNVSDFASTERFYLNGRPTTPTVVANKYYPANQPIDLFPTGSADPDGDPFDYYGGFRRDRLIFKTRLEPDQATPGEWWFQARAMDNRGAQSDLSDTQLFVYDPTALPSLTSVEPSSLQAVNVPEVFYQHTATPNGYEPAIQMDTDPTFAAPQEETQYESGVAFHLGARPDGLYDVHHRMKTVAGVSNVITTQVFLDRVAPEAGEIASASTYSNDGTMDFTWRLPEDPAPSSGIHAAAADLRRDDSDSTETLMVLPIPPQNGQNTLILPQGVKGGRFVLGMRATDEAGNRGALASSESFHINARPLPPVLHVRPRYTASETIKPPLEASVDPDGDKIYSYHYRFTRLAPAPAVTHEVLELPPELHAPGEVWQVDGYGVDSAGGKGWPSEVHTFTVVDSPPTDAPVLQGVNPAYQAVKVPQATFTAWGESAASETFVEMSRDADFSAPQQETWYNFRTSAYYFGDLPDGHYTVHHRLTAGYGISDPLTTRVDLDRVPPNPPEPIVHDYGFERGEVAVAWRVPIDPEPGSGVEKFEATLFRADRDTSTPLASGVGEGENGAILLQVPPGVIGGSFRAELTATDKAGNVSAPRVTEPFTLNGRPSVPIIDLPARVPTGEYIVPGVSGAVDPEGDPVTYQYMFYPWPPYAPLTIFREYLGPWEAMQGNGVWRFQVTAADSHGAQSSAGVLFTLFPGLPSRPEVRISPAAPRPGDSLHVGILQESVDPDGDQVKYHYTWLRSSNPELGGNEVSELRDQTEVPAEMLRDGDIWRVVCTAYQETALPGQEPIEVSGGRGWDAVRVSATNTPPDLTVGLPRVVNIGADTRVRVTWDVSDAQKDSTSVEIYLVDPDQTNLESPRVRVDGSAGGAEFQVMLSSGRPYYLLVIARDAQGAVTQQTSSLIIGTGVPPNGWLLD